MKRPRLDSFPVLFIVGFPAALAAQYLALSLLGERLPRVHVEAFAGAIAIMVTFSALMLIERGLRRRKGPN
jgi:hypothetical protein